MALRNPRWTRTLGVMSFVVILSLGFIGGAAVFGFTAHRANLAGFSNGGSRATGLASVGATGSAPLSTDPASAIAHRALSAASASGISARDVFVPRPSATSADLVRATTQGHVTPLYNGIPAPVGLAYYGLSEGSHGSVVASTLNTTSVRGQVHADSILPQDLFQSSPDSYGIQLNSVTTNVTLFGTPGYQFWTQNVVEYFPSAELLVLVTNVWNFSAPGAGMTPNVFYTHGPFGVLVPNVFYFAQYFVPFPVTYPFDLTLFMNSTLQGGRNAVDFSVCLSGAGENFALPYDYVVFNSTTTTSPPVTVPSNYTADGFNYNPIGLTNDYELIFGGPGGGSQVSLGTASAALGLAYWDASKSAYVATPAAYSYGGETGETATGATVSWSSASGGPGGLSDWGLLRTGPSFDRGLWNAGAAKGAVPVTIQVTPANAWDIFTPDNSTTSLQNFLIAEPAAQAGVYGDTFWLTPGTYTVQVGLSDYRAVTLTIVATGATTSYITLRANPADGVYTPLWAESNSQVAAISSSGAGTPTHPYLLDNNQKRPLSAAYGLYNDFGFPVFAGVFLNGTTASAQVFHGASLVTDTNLFQFPGPELPPTNDLQLWFWGVTGVGVVDSFITGWFGANTYSPAVFDTFNVIFYESSGNLIAGNAIATQGEGLLLFSGGNFFTSEINVGGGNNTVWGNTFTESAAPNTPESVMPLWFGFPVGLGLEISENSDLIYNNWFGTPTTAWLLPLNLYTGTAYAYQETWNIATQKASHVQYASGFPTVPLAGSIVGGSIQGGNFWWDYGVNNTFNGAVNPLGVLPYDENATTLILFAFGPAYYHATYIYNGGDFAPLLLPSSHGHSH